MCIKYVLFFLAKQIEEENIKIFIWHDSDWYFLSRILLNLNSANTFHIQCMRIIFFFFLFIITILIKKKLHFREKNKDQIEEAGYHRKSAHMHTLTLFWQFWASIRYVRVRRLYPSNVWNRFFFFFICGSVICTSIA